MIPNDLTRYVLAHVVMRHYDARHPVVADDLIGQSRSAIPDTPGFWNGRRLCTLPVVAVDSQED